MQPDPRTQWRTLAREMDPADYLALQGWIQAHDPSDDTILLEVKSVLLFARYAAATQAPGPLDLAYWGSLVDELKAERAALPESEKAKVA